MIWMASTFLAVAAMEPAGDVDVNALLRRMADRARAVARDTNAPIYVYKTVSAYETLDGRSGQAFEGKGLPKSPCAMA